VLRLSKAVTLAGISSSVIHIHTERVDEELNERIVVWCDVM
jgi:hypothetical protein